LTRTKKAREILERPPEQKEVRGVIIVGLLNQQGGRKKSRCEVTGIVSRKGRGLRGLLKIAIGKEFKSTCLAPEKKLSHNKGGKMQIAKSVI